MYLDTLKSFCKTPSDCGLRIADLGLQKERLREYTFDTSIPPDTTEDEGEVFAEVVEKELS